MTEYPNREMPLSELRLGDTVQVFNGPYGTGIVNQVDDKNVYFYRPYGHAEDWSHSGGVICFTGLEIFSRSRLTTETIHVWRRETIA